MAVMTTIQRSGKALHQALADLSPEEAGRFHDEYRDALTRAADSFDLSDAEAVFTRWWDIAHIRANPGRALSDRRGRQLALPRRLPGSPRTGHTRSCPTTRRRVCHRT